MFDECLDFRPALPAPITGVSDAPGVWVFINNEWASHLEGQIANLLHPTSWQGTDEEVETATQQIELLLVTLANGQNPMIEPHMVGTIVITVPGSTLPQGVLINNGAVFYRVDWPELYQYYVDNSSPNIIDADSAYIFNSGTITINVPGVGNLAFPLATVAKSPTFS